MAEINAAGGWAGEDRPAGFVFRPETLPPFWEQHYPVAYWAKCWGFSAKTVREWFQEEFGPGILRQANQGRRLKRDYVTLSISASAAARVYSKHSEQRLTN
jgi:hypothetical protein